MKEKNMMRNILIDKITVNINVGNDKVKMDKAKALIEMLTKRKPKYCTAKKRIATWSIRPGLPIGYKVTIRRDAAKEVLGMFLKARSLELKQSKIDLNGNFSFGIPEYLDLPGVKYNAEVGVMGFEVMVTFKRKGYRIAKRSYLKKKIPMRHKVTKSEVIAFMQKEFGSEVFSS